MGCYSVGGGGNPQGMTDKVEDSWIILGLVVDLGFRGSLGKKCLAKAMAWPPINSLTSEVFPCRPVFAPNRAIGRSILVYRTGCCADGA